MQNQEPLVCLSCQATNQYTSRTCCACGQSLAPARTSYYLDLTEADITNGRYEHARGNLAKADVEMFGLSPEQRREYLLTARAFWLQSLIYYYKGHIQEAREELILALQNLEGKAGGELMLANVLNNLGNVALYEDNAEAAANYYLRSIEVALQTDEHSVAAKAMGNLSIVHSNDGDMDEARDWCLRGLEQAELSGEPLRLGEAYRLLAGIYASEGPFSLALSYASKSLALCERIEDQACVCRINDEAGELYLQYRDLEQADKCLREAQEIAQRTGYRLVQLATLTNLAELMRLKGDDEAWFSYASRAYNVFNTAIYERGKAILQLIMYYLDKQNWVQARKYLQMLEDATGQDATHIERYTLSRAQALLHAATGEWDEAEACFTEAIELMSATHDRYRLTDIKEEYATLLLHRATAEPGPDVYAKAYTVLDEVAKSFRSLEMPLRLAAVEARMEDILNRATPSATVHNVPASLPASTL